MRVSNQVNFAMIPEWVLYSGISPQAIRLYCVLNRHADKQRKAKPSRARMAKLMNDVSVKTVDRAMDELTAIGAVTIKARYTDRGDQTSNWYILNAVPQGATQMSMGVDTDDETPLDTDDQQNESPSELDTSPKPPSTSEGGLETISDEDQRSVECPTCDADAGEPCISSRGRPRVALHQARREFHGEHREREAILRRRRAEDCESCDGMGVIEEDGVARPCPVCRPPLEAVGT